MRPHCWPGGEGFATRRVIGDGPLDRLDTRMRNALRAFEKRPQFYRVLVLLLGSGDPNAVLLMERYRTQVQSTVLVDFQELDLESATDLAGLWWGVVTHLLTNSIFHGSEMADAYRIMERFMSLLRNQFPMQS